MNQHTVDRRVRKTKYLLKKGLLQLLQKKHIYKVTVKELTDSLDLGRGTFYFHYHDIYELLEEIEKDMLKDFKLTMDMFSATDLKNKPGPLILESMLFIARNKEIIIILIENNRDFTQKVMQVVGDKCINDWPVLYNVSNTEYYAYFSTYVINGCSSILNYWLKDDLKMPIEDMAEVLEQMIINGIKVLE